jgi:hypothetical protein
MMCFRQRTPTATHQCLYRRQRVVDHELALGEGALCEREELFRERVVGRQLEVV